MEESAKDRCYILGDIAAQVVQTEPVPHMLGLENRGDSLVCIGKVSSVSVRRDNQEKAVDSPFMIFNGLRCLKHICNVPHLELMVNDDPDIEWHIVLVLH